MAIRTRVSLQRGEIIKRGGAHPSVAVANVEIGGVGGEPEHGVQILRRLHALHLHANVDGRRLGHG